MKEKKKMEKLFSEASPRKVAVLGGGGFIGRSFVRKLVATGHVVRIGSQNPEVIQGLGKARGTGRVEFLKVSVSDADQLDRLFDGADAAVNLVSVMTPDIRVLHKINVDGAHLAAVRARRAGVKQYVHMSAIGASLTSPGAYGRSKGAAEQVVRRVFPDAGLLRPSVVFGPEDSFFNLFALIAAVSPVLPVFAQHTHYQPVFVEDVAEALLRLLEPEHAGRIVEAGGPDILSMRDMMAFVLEVSGRHRLLLPIPGVVARFEASVLEKLPGHLLTRDQVAMMSVDNVVHPGLDNLQTLDIHPISMRMVVPEYLKAGVFRLYQQLKS
ncbi:oxidoreductase [Gluconobacter thailandicus]|nr:oxidoreductase [Gluconobacter thailandicus]